MNNCLAVVIVLCLLINVGVNCKTKKVKSVTTLLDAQWQVTPLVLEVAEYLADENPDFYWNFIDSICNLNPPLHKLGTVHLFYVCNYL